MKTYAKLREVPITAIQPEGWLRRYLEKQRDGLTGHLEAAGFPFNTKGWANSALRTRHGLGWWPYEQVGYWVDGMVRAGHLLGDEFLLAKARRQLDYVLAHQGRDGYLGPPFMREAVGQNRWPHAVLFRALIAEHSATGDARIVKAIARHYLSGTAPHGDERDVCNIEPILWAYEQTGDRRLLEHALDAYDEYQRLYPRQDTTPANMLSGKRPTEHGVTYNEIAKLGALLYVYTGRKRLLDATTNAYRKIDRWSMLVDGVCSSTERLRGKDPLDSHETCDIADYTWSIGHLLMATGRAEYADKIERACFNAAPGAVTHDFKGVQYFSCPNQVIADTASNHNLYFRGATWMSYRPNPGTECCPGEINRVMPNYAARMWMTDVAGGLVAALYGPSRITTHVGPTRQAVTVVEDTAYPFSDRIEFQIRTARPVAFPFTLRIPGWCRRAEILVNGKRLKRTTKPGTFVTIRRTFRHNDRATLVLPMKLRLTRWPRGGVAIERGPLVYSLRINEDWRIDPDEKRCTKAFPAWNIYPASRWNYALDVDARTLERDVEVIERPVHGDPWSIESAPIELHVPARRVRGWRIVHRRRVTAERSVAWKTVYETKEGDFRFTPQLPDPASVRKRLSRRVETVTLIPYGCTHLRLTIFPRAR